MYLARVSARAAAVFLRRSRVTSGSRRQGATCLLPQRRFANILPGGRAWSAGWVRCRRSWGGRLRREVPVTGGRRGQPLHLAGGNRPVRQEGRPQHRVRGQSPGAVELSQDAVLRAGASYRVRRRPGQARERNEYYRVTWGSRVGEPVAGATFDHEPVVEAELACSAAPI
jgi:hypothetical protein